MSVRLRLLWPIPAVLGAAFVAHPGLACLVGVDFWNVGEARAEIAAAAASDRRLTERGDTIRRRIVIKEALVTELIAGRLGLAEAAARFLELDEEEPDNLAALRKNFPDDSDLVRSFRNVIRWVGHSLPDPTHRADLCTQLEAELARMLDVDNPAVP